MRGDDDATVAGGGRRSRTHTVTATAAQQSKKALSLCFRVGVGLARAKDGAGRDGCSNVTRQQVGIGTEESNAALPCQVLRLRQTFHRRTQEADMIAVTEI